METECSLPCSQEPTTRPCPEADESSLHLTNQPTQWSGVLLEKLIVTQLVKKFPTFHEDRKFLTVFTRNRHWSAYWVRCIHSTTFQPHFPKMNF